MYGWSSYLDIPIFHDELPKSPWDQWLGKKNVPQIEALVGFYAILLLTVKYKFGKLCKILIIKHISGVHFHQTVDVNMSKQAGAELCQAQVQLSY